MSLFVMIVKIKPENHLFQLCYQETNDGLGGLTCLICIAS